MGRGRRATRAAAALTASGVPFELREYEVAEGDEQRSLGEAAAAALGVDATTMFKTLVALVDDAPACAVVPTSGSLSLKALAAAAGGKRARMADPADAEKWTGYVTGGISPIGQKRKLPTFLDSSALALERVHVSGGRRGLEIELAPEDLVRATEATVVEGLGR